MKSDTLLLSCPCCWWTFPAPRPPEPVPRWSIAERVEARCPACAWEFVADRDGFVEDDGELDHDWVFEVDEEGDLTAATDDLPGGRLMSRWEMDREQGLAEQARRDEDEDEYGEEEDEGAPQAGPFDAECPGCRQRLRGVCLGPLRCPYCDGCFSVNYERPEYEEEDDEEGPRDDEDDLPRPEGPVAALADQCDVPIVVSVARAV